MDSSSSVLNQYLDPSSTLAKVNTNQPSSWGVYQKQEGKQTIVYRHEVHVTQRGKRRLTYLEEKPYVLVTDGSLGKPIVVRRQPMGNDVIGFDEENHQGEVCPKCGKGILLVDNGMLLYCNKHPRLEFNLTMVPGPIFCFCFLPCFIFYCCFASHKKRMCTNCSEKFEGKWGICTRIHSRKENMFGKCLCCY